MWNHEFLESTNLKIPFFKQPIHALKVHFMPFALYPYHIRTISTPTASCLYRKAFSAASNFAGMYPNALWRDLQVIVVGQGERAHFHKISSHQIKNYLQNNTLYSMPTKRALLQLRNVTANRKTMALWNSIARRGRIILNVSVK